VDSCRSELLFIGSKHLFKQTSFRHVLFATLALDLHQLLLDHLQPTDHDHLRTHYKVKSTIPHEECWWGAHLPYLGSEPVGG